MAHAVLGPSSAKRWMTCPGSIRMSEGIENKSSRYADEGTEAHALAETILRSLLAPEDFDAAREAYEAQFVATEEMLDAVRVYVDKVRSYTLAGIEAEILLEQRVTLANMPVWGTADLIAYIPALRRLIVGDYKHGAGVAVEVAHNPQLMIYALGAWHLAMKQGWIVESVETFICQPRKEHDDGPIRTQAYGTLELLDFLDDVIEAVQATEQPDAPLVAGEHCRFCPAKALCPTRVNAVTAVVDVPGVPRLPIVSAMSVEQAAEILAAADRVEFAKWLDDVRGFLQREAESGRAVPGYKLVEKRAVRKWKEADTVVASRLAETVDERLLWETPEPALKSPAQVEKLVGKGKIPADLVFKESSGFNLVPESAKGAAVLVSPGDEFETI